MLKIQNFIFIIIALSIAIFTSGCYTIVSYPPELEERYIESEAELGEVYGYDEYYHEDYPYPSYWDYYDPYYGPIYPYSYYWDSPWYYYNDYYRGYDHYYTPSHVPEKKPETRYRGAANVRNRSNNVYKRSNNSEKKEEN